jgi:hypothetical protein
MHTKRYFHVTRGQGREEAETRLVKQERSRILVSDRGASFRCPTVHA